MNHVISIGINNVDGLPSLDSAVSGAIDFDKWAKSQNYTTKLFVDSESKISLNQIFSEILKIIKDGNCEKLIIFFSGHGTLKGTNQEVWLLSDAKTNPNEAINLPSSINNARTTGIPYVVFISDACRVLPAELALTGNGGDIFPILTNPQKTFIDLFYATKPGNPAYEVSCKDNSEKFGLFTQALVEILNGNYPDTIDCQVQPNGAYIPLTSFFDSGLKHHYKHHHFGEFTIKAMNVEEKIESLVREKAKKISILLSQESEIIVQHQNPKPYLSKFDITNAESIYAQKAKNKIGDFKSESNFLGKEILEALDQYIFFTNNGKNFKDIIMGMLPLYNMEYEANNLFDNDMILHSKKIFNATGKESDVLKTGFTIVGDVVEDIIVFGEEREIFWENDCLQVNIKNAKNVDTALIILKNGQSIPVAILNEFIGTLVFDESKLLTINYTPSSYNEKFEEFQRNKIEIDFARAFIASAAAEGLDYEKVFQHEFNDEGNFEYNNAGSFLRKNKSLDPSLGLYAAYAFLQSGNVKKIESIYNYIKNEGDDIIFDIAMLAGKKPSNKRLFSANYKIRSFCPMLSLGWAYRSKFDSGTRPEILDAAKYLVPGLWTTFEKEGTQILKKLIQNRRLNETVLYTR
ncbi:MAG: caspase family protein [Flavobacterium sp.]